MYHIESCWGYMKGEDNKEREGTGLKEERIIVCFLRLWYIRILFLTWKKNHFILKQMLILDLLSA